MMRRLRPFPRFLSWLGLGWAAWSCSLAVAFAADAALKSFDIPPGEAEVALKLFSQQSGKGVVFAPDGLKGVRTNAVAGRYAPHEALDRLVAGTPLAVRVEEKTGAFAIRRTTGPNVARAAAPTGRPEAGVEPAARIHRLSPFEIRSSEIDEGATVVSATRFETPERQLPVVVDVISERTLNEWNYDNLMLALESLTPGIGSAAAPREAIIRGMPSDYAMRNGVPVTNFFGTAPLSRIEVVRGATGVLFGITQPGGVRNMISKRPTEKPAYDLSVTYDTHHGNRTVFGASGPLTPGGQLGYRLGAVYAELGDRYAQDERYRYDRLLYPALLWKPAPATQVFLEFDYVYYNANGSNLSPVVRRNGENFNRPPTPNNLGYALSPSFDAAGPSTHQSQRVRLWNLVVDQGLGERWDFRGMYSWQLYDQLAYQRQQNGFLRPGDTAVNVTHRAVNNRFRQEFARLDLLGKFEWPGINHKMLVGADYVWRLSTDQTIWTDATRRPNGTYAVNIYRLDFADYHRQSFANNWLYDFNDFEARMPVSAANQGWVEDYGTYVVNQLEFTRFRTHLLAGLRHDHMIEGASRPVVNYVAEAGGRVEPESVTNHVSPQLGLVYQLSREVSLFANYSTSVYPNRVINPDGKSLDAQTGKGFDIGVKFGLWGERLTGLFNVFDMYRQNLPVADPAADVDPSRAGFFVLIGEAKSRGYEANLTFKWTRNLTLMGSYAYADAYEADTRVPLVRSFKHSGLLQINYRVGEGPLKGLSTGLAVRARAKIYFGQAGRNYAPSDDSVSVRLGYPVVVLGRRINLQLNVRNVIEQVEISDEVGGGWGRENKRLFLFTAEHKF